MWWRPSRTLDLILTNQERIMAALDDIQAKVTAEGTVVQSAITLLQGLKQALDAAGQDPAKLAELSSDLDAQTQALAAAVAANTPAAPAPVAEPAPEAAPQSPPAAPSASG